MIVGGPTDGDSHKARKVFVRAVKNWQEAEVQEEERYNLKGKSHYQVKMGDSPLQRVGMVNFLIVDAPSSYTVILGRPSLDLFQVTKEATRIYEGNDAYIEQMKLGYNQR
ncbi:hypothetical protein ACS0TY_021517 [Phlomoides rotata]